MKRRPLTALVAGATLAGGAWSVGTAYAEHQDVLREARRVVHDAAPEGLGARAASPMPPAEPVVLTAAPQQQRPVREPRRKPAKVTPPPAPVLLAPGAHGPEVRELQARLRQIAWFSGDVTDFYGDQTRAAVAGFQTKRGLPSTGSLDTVTLERLEGMTSEPTADELANAEPEPAATEVALDPRCLTGRVLWRRSRGSDQSR